jgi:hypothetical protein
MTDNAPQATRQRRSRIIAWFRRPVGWRRGMLGSIRKDAADDWMRSHEAGLASTGLTPAEQTLALQLLQKLGRRAEQLALLERLAFPLALPILLVAVAIPAIRVLPWTEMFSFNDQAPLRELAKA